MCTSGNKNDKIVNEYCNIIKIQRLVECFLYIQVRRLIERFSIFPRAKQLECYSLHSPITKLFIGFGYAHSRNLQPLTQAHKTNTGSSVIEANMFTILTLLTGSGSPVKTVESRQKMFIGNKRPLENISSRKHNSRYANKYNILY